MDTQADADLPLAELSGVLSADLIGHDQLIERLLIAILTGGHVLVEGAPGLAKTRAVKCLAEAVDGRFARIQGTPDLMPSDITGTQVLDPQSGQFRFSEGPVFANLVLMDEINRAPPKVQSALLEAMAEGQVSAGAKTYPLPDPFLVVATQNPIEQEGTFPLPEAQLDRFMMHVILTLPTADQEMQILELVEAELSGLTQDGKASPTSVLTRAGLLAARRAVQSVHVAPELKDYIVRLVMATRAEAMAPKVAHAVSPRGSLALLAGARARALLHGRSYAAPEDVLALAPDVLAHRLVLTWRSIADGDSPRSVIAALLAEVDPL